MTFTRLLTFVSIFLLTGCAMAPRESDIEIDHVLILGFDGLSGSGLRKANNPNLDRLMREGAYSLYSRSVMPTSSSPNWASMIMGAGPMQHGITSNAWEKDDFPFPPVVADDAGYFPTIFHLLNVQKPETEVGVVHHWSGFGRLFNQADVDFVKDTKDELETALVLAEYLEQKHPNYCFVHFDHIDHAGHHDGHGTPKYLESITRADSLVGLIMKSLEKARMMDKTLIIVNSDHGGIGYGHGGESLEELQTPFILWGPGVKQNHRLKEATYVYDNPATAAYVLGLKVPEAWVGRPIKSALLGTKTPSPIPSLKILMRQHFHIHRAFMPRLADCLRDRYRS